MCLGSWTLIERCPQGLPAQPRREGIWIAGREQGARGGKGREVYVKKQERVTDIQVYLSVSPSLREWVTKGTGRPALSEGFFLFSLFLLNNGLLSDIDMLPVCQFYSLIFCHFYCVKWDCRPLHECLCVFLSSDCDLQSGRIVPAAALGSQWYLPPATFHFTQLTSSGSDR